jgi:hypothetical protein
VLLLINEAYVSKPSFSLEYKPVQIYDEEMPEIFEDCEILGSHEGKYQELEC